MGEDLYSKLLKVPDGPRPPDYYTLLGLEIYEVDHDRIRDAVLERTALLRTRALDPNPERAKQIQLMLNEVGKAGATLRDPAAKSKYDDGLLVDQLGLDPTQRLPPRREAHEPQEPPGGDSAAEARCPDCGAELAAGAVFCVNCGLFLDDGTHLDVAADVEEGEWTGSGDPDEEWARPRPPRRKSRPTSLTRLAAALVPARLRLRPKLPAMVQLTVRLAPAAAVIAFGYGAYTLLVKPALFPGGQEPETTPVPVEEETEESPKTPVPPAPIAVDLPKEEIHPAVEAKARAILGQAKVWQKSGNGARAVPSLRRLIDDYPRTASAIEALSMLAEVSDAVAKDLMGKPTKEAESYRYLGLGYGSSGGKIVHVYVSGSTGARELHDTIRLGEDGGDLEAAARAAWSLVSGSSRVSTGIRWMACYYGARWRRHEKTPAGSKEGDAFALYEQAVAFAREGRHDEAARTAKRLQTGYADTFASRFGWEESVVKDLSDRANKSAAAGDPARACALARDAIRCYGHVSAVQYLAVHAWAWQLTTGDRDAEREASAQERYKAALGMDMDRRLPAAEALVARYPKTFTGEYLARWQLPQWRESSVRQQLSEARNLTYRRDYAGALSALAAMPRRTRESEEWVQLHDEALREQQAADMFRQAGLYETRGDTPRYLAKLTELVEKFGNTHKGREAKNLLQRHERDRAEGLFEVAQALAELGDTTAAIAMADRLRAECPDAWQARSVTSYRSRWQREPGPGMKRMAFSSGSGEQRESVRQAVEDGLVVPIDPENEKSVDVLEDFARAVDYCRRGSSIWRNQFAKATAESKGMLRVVDFERRLREGREFVFICEGTGPCAECKGTGYEKYGSGREVRVQCNVCGGRGFTGTRNAACRECRGTGMDDCPKCRGSGRVRDPKGRRDYHAIGGVDVDSNGEMRCNTCRGRGQTTCTVCRGRKTAIVRDECRDCDGKGELEVHVCDECNGSREVPNIEPYRVVQ